MVSDRHGAGTAGEAPDVIRWRLHATPCGVLRLGAFGGRLCLCDWADVPARDFVVRRLERGLHARFAEWPNERLRPGTGLPGIPAEPESNFPDNPDDADRCVLDRAVRQLDEYFAAQRRTFDIPLLPVGTPFQRAVWELLTEIPPGEIRSYAWLAARLGHPQAVRAVAAANRANALSIFIPCHRVVGSDGSLTGYAGGLAAKRLLLELEQATLLR